MFIKHTVLPIPDKGVSPQSTSGGVQYKISQLFKLPKAVEEHVALWHSPLSPRWLLPDERKDGQKEANCDYI